MKVYFCSLKIEHMTKAFTFFAILFTISTTAQVVESSQPNLDFGLVNYGEESTLSLELTNLSDEEVEIEEVLFFNIYNSSPFQVSTMPSSIAAGSSAMMEITFNPIHNIAHDTEMIIKTSGNRGAVSIDLQGACDYPGDYYDYTFGEMDEDLEDVLEDILSDGYNSLGYNYGRDLMYMEFDNQAVNGQGSAQNRLTRSYIGTDAVGFSSRGDAQSQFNLNTEHTFPQGNFNSNEPMKSDVHHLFVTDVDANSVRGNLRFGNVVSNIDWSEGGSVRGQNASGALVFEPRDAHKGKSARAILYFVTRYQNYGGHLSEDMEDAMREWHAQFPPTDVERNRNDDIYGYQNNRNPFVDYPQFVDRIFSFRLDQDRPNIGELAISHSTADFGVVEGSTVEFNLVLTNIGERFFSVSDATVSGEGFSLSTTQEESFVILDGESKSIRVAFDPSAAQGAATGTLTFNTNLSSTPNVTVPLSAEGILSMTNLSESGITVLPNPAQEFFRLSGSTEDISTIRVLDLQGRPVASFANSAAEYSLQSISNGIYLVQVSFKNGTSGIQRLVVNR